MPTVNFTIASLRENESKWRGPRSGEYVCRQNQVLNIALTDMMVVAVGIAIAACPSLFLRGCRCLVCSRAAISAASYVRGRSL